MKYSNIEATRCCKYLMKTNNPSTTLPEGGFFMPDNIRGDRIEKNK